MLVGCIDMGWSTAGVITAPVGCIMYGRCGVHDVLWTWYVETGEAAMKGVIDVCGIMRLVARLYGEE